MVRGVSPRVIVAGQQLRTTANGFHVQSPVDDANETNGDNNYYFYKQVASS